MGGYITKEEYGEAGEPPMSLNVTAGGAFVAGLLSFASPCVLPLVPPYLANISGVSIEQWRDAGGAKTRTRVVLAALCFVAGFSTVFVALGATASWIGQAMGALLVVAGILIFSGQMPTIAVWLIETFPALGRIG